MSAVTDVTDRIRNCCDQCAHSKIRCDSKRPTCLNCRRRDRLCTYSYVRQSGRPRRIRPAHSDRMDNQESVGRAGENARSTAAGQYCPLSTTAAPSSSPVVTAAPAPAPAPALPSMSSCDQFQAILDGEASHYADHGYHTGGPGANLALENTTVECLNSLAIPHMQHSTSTDYSASAPAETVLSMDIYNGVHDQAHEDTFMSIEQFLTMADQSTPLSPPPTDYSQLGQGLHGLLDDSRISSIVDGMINSPLQNRCLACATELRDKCFHSAAYNGSDDDQLCRCPTMLNKLYLLVMDPKLSQPTKMLPLDLILFLEQALQNTFETMKHCTVCGSSTLSSANEITLCIVANWIANSIQIALESEIDMFTSRKSSRSLWGCSERHAMVMGTAREQHHGNVTNSAAVPPSLDARNSLQIGMWSVSSEAWALCVSAILAKRVKRMQQILSAVGGDSMEVAEMVKNVTTARAKREMAKDIHAKAEILLGMIRTWVSEYHLQC